jgi:hypothetical protein
MTNRNLFKDNDLVIITGEDNRGYFRIFYDEENYNYVIKKDNTYNSSLNSECLKFVENLDDTNIDYILDEYTKITIDVYRQTEESRMGKRIFFVDLFTE